jgi:hypothetical protein
VLTVLALMGVGALALTLVTHSARPAPRTVRAASARPAPGEIAAPPKPSLTSSLRGALEQELQQLVGSPRLLRSPSVVVPLAQPPGGSCFVSRCSENPCVVFTQSAAAPADTASSADLVIPAPAAAPLTRSRCVRRAGPHALPVSDPTLSVTAR